MTNRLPMIALLLLGACARSAAEDDEPRLKNKSYVPRKTLGDASYTAQAYRAPQPLPVSERTLPTPRKTGGWNLFTWLKSDAPAEQARSAPLEDAQPYTQLKHISVPTIKADPRDIPEKKPFEETGNKLEDLNFKPADKPRSKNPLLTPRQGIKAPE